MLLVFFASWCGACREQMPLLQKVWDDFGQDERFAMLVIGRGETPETVQSYKSANQYTFPMAADPETMVFRKFASESVPRMYFVSGDGTILFQSTGCYPEEVEKLRLRDPTGTLSSSVNFSIGGSGC